MGSVKERLKVFLFIAFVILLVTIPFVFADQASGSDYEFNGFVFNALDGNTYLAKMRQGWNGSWTFTLPYTPDPGEGTYLNMFYIILGHLARITGWSLLFTYHFSRVAGAVILLIILFRLCRKVFESSRSTWIAFLLVSLGSGMGWMLFPFGIHTSDIAAIPETYPFMSAFSTPHFAWGIAIQIWLLIPRDEKNAGWKSAASLVLSSFVGAVVSPFVIVIVLVVRGGVVLWKVIQGENIKQLLTSTFTIGLVSGPFLFYYFWIARTHPVLAGWSAQNITVTRPLWDVIVSLSPAFILAVPGAILIWRKNTSIVKFLIAWAGLSLILIYTPFSLQRRFMTGWYVPIALLAVVFIEDLLKNRPASKVVVIVALFILALPTNIVLLLGARHGALNHNPGMYLTRGEAEALAWIDEETEAGALILASGEIGSFIPAYSNGRVLFGHPYETVNAEYWQDEVNGFFEGKINYEEREDFLKVNQIDYIFYGERERELGLVDWLEAFEEVFNFGGVVIYKVER